MVAAIKEPPRNANMGGMDELLEKYIKPLQRQMAVVISQMGNATGTAARYTGPANPAAGSTPGQPAGAPPQNGGGLRRSRGRDRGPPRAPSSRGAAATPDTRPTQNARQTPYREEIYYNCQNSVSAAG